MVGCLEVALRSWKVVTVRVTVFDDDIVKMMIDDGVNQAGG